ncbi:DUF4412 domain-containing protein [Actomonas aquatica]|uniref:DUF4412 domain-containing protein n=1 Tax=Actomonas aquatica TaxID=2866162 RepID=A0ABZ1C2F4_9BACT|nr:DUF4412 domain-containing protein [Opitutus sp. WL0086]WRQ85887.1 DUF4412 domain-containing protein [Opitutus sp. WL0086]
MQFSRTAFAVATCCLACLTPAAVSAAAFEGQIDMAMTEGRQTFNVSYQTKAGHMRIAMPVPGMGETAALVDFEAGKIMTLIPPMKAYMEIPFDVTMDEATDRAASAGELKNTGETTEILGYTCTKYIYEEDQGPVEIWATDQLGQFMAMPKGNPMQGGGAVKTGWESAIKGNFFPMRLVALTKRGKERMRWEVTAVKPMSIPDSAFAPPAGYKPFDMGAMMQGLGGFGG